MMIKSYAKINLSLQITGVREDGYHELDMVNLPLHLHDVVDFDYSPLYRETYITCDNVGLLGTHSNICKKAVDVMRAEHPFKQHFVIHIHKEIPFAAGLGGGSSNAACVLEFLNRFCKLNLSLEELCRIGLKIGSDVPYFLINKPARIKGTGEIVEPISSPTSYHCLLIKPEQGLSTKAVYSICDKFERQKIDNDKVVQGIENGDDELVSKNIGNDLFLPANSLCNEVGNILGNLQKDGFALSGMSGSGSTVFALSNNLKKIREAALKYGKKGYEVILTKTFPSS